MYSLRDVLLPIPVHAPPVLRVQPAVPSGMPSRRLVPASSYQRRRRQDARISAPEPHSC